MINYDSENPSISCKDPYGYKTSWPYGWDREADHILFAFCRPDTLDPALLRPGRLDRKVEFGLPDLEGRTQIFKIHTRTMNCERDIRFELLARLCPNSTGECTLSFFFQHAFC